MIYLKKIIAQDLDRTASFSLESIDGFFNIQIPNGGYQVKVIRLIQTGSEFRIEFKHRENRHEYHVFMADIFFQFDPSVGDILIFSKINNDLFECEHIRQTNPRYPILSAHFAQDKNHKLIDNI